MPIRPTHHSDLPCIYSIFAASFHGEDLHDTIMHRHRDGIPSTIRLLES